MLRQTKLQNGGIAIALSSVMMLFLALPLLGVDEPSLLSKKELKTLIADAKTPADHERLAKHFTAKADQLAAESKEHEELAAQYKANPNMHEQKHPMSAQTAGHCQYFAKKLREASADARKLATDHERMAKEASK